MVNPGIDNKEPYFIFTFSLSGTVRIKPFTTTDLYGIIQDLGSDHTILVERDIVRMF